MQTIRIDILNEKVLELLKKLEELNLVKVEKTIENRNSKKPSSYKGVLSKKLRSEIQDHIKQSRSEWL